MRRFIFVLFLVTSFWLLVTGHALAQTTTYTVGNPNETTFYGKFGGFGAEWDPFFWNTNNLNRGTNQAAWDLITTRIQELNVGIIRMMMQLKWAQAKADLSQWTWTTPQMQSVFKYLDFACQNNIDVILTDWGWAVRGDLYSSPTDMRFATGVAEYLKEFIDRRGYTCIKYLVIGNEPDNEIQKDYGQAAYETMYQNIDTALKANGMRPKVKLTAPDMGGQWDFMKTSISDMKAYVDTYDFHRYASTAETGNFNLPGTWETLWSHLDLWRGEVNSRDPNASGKQLLLTEMGNDGGGTNSHPDIDLFKYAIHMADYGTTTLTTRVNAAITWTMHDIYYFDGGQYMQWGMWRYLDNNWSIRPWGQAFGLLIKHAPKDSIQAPVNGTPPAQPPLSTQRVAALKRPNGGWSLFLVNRDTTAKNIVLNLPQAPTHSFSLYRFDSTSNSSYPNTIALPPQSTLTLNASNTLTLPAESLTVLSENVTSTTPTPPPSTDYDGDGDTDYLDFLILVRSFTNIFSFNRLVGKL